MNKIKNLYYSFTRKIYILKRTILKGELEDEMT